MPRGGAKANGGAHVRAPTCARQPRGTALGGRERVTELRSIVPTATASDQWSLCGLGVHARVYGGEGQSGVARRRAGARSGSKTF
jgi:hypothetical protein